MRGSQPRGAVDAFIVMDVMEQARAAGGAGPATSSTWRWASPNTGDWRARARRWRRRWRPAPWATTVALGLAFAGVAAGHRRSLPPLVWRGSGPGPRGGDGRFRPRGFLLASSALFDAGERVALEQPGYPSYRQVILRALSLEPVGIPTSPENRLQPVPEDLEGVPDLAGLIVASPGNPSGDHARRSEALAALIEHAQARDIAFISDEIYHGLDYGTRAVSALEISDDVYVINSFSKYFSMTGWRLGWLVVPEAHVRDGRAAGAEHVHLPAACQPDRGAGRAGLPAGAGGQPRRLCREPPPDARGRCRRPGSPALLRRTGRSTSMPMCRT
ncbi:MAG: aminotransferase class I/II-fold pyridoxal phosphate-dependent enzyme [Rhodopseudomonas palustris]|nr:aminotransferase class I/II-fold pyridoxal phosphate-dependent enzyme [Rhodopseudomonas palustris]